MRNSLDIFSGHKAPIANESTTTTTISIHFNCRGDLYMLLGSVAKFPRCCIESRAMVDNFHSFQVITVAVTRRRR